MIPNNKTRRTSTRAILMQPTVAGIFQKKVVHFILLFPIGMGQSAVARIDRN